MLGLGKYLKTKKKKTYYFHFSGYANKENLNTWKV